jgi:hypothetical protein
MFVHSTKKCDWEEYWEQEKVEARLKEKGDHLDSYIGTTKRRLVRWLSSFVKAEHETLTSLEIIGESVYGRRLMTRMKH